MRNTELHRALIGQGNTIKEADKIMKGMIRGAGRGENPEELLHEQGLEPDYVFDLLY